MLPQGAVSILFYVCPDFSQGWCLMSSSLLEVLFLKQILKDNDNYL